MKQRLLGVELLLLAALITGCRTTHIQTPPVQTVPAPKQTLQEKKSALKSKQKSPTLPAVLGGMVQSDEWVIYKDKEQEEFKGNVFYDNGIYTFKAGYALSDRKNHTFTASQNVYVKQQEPGTVSEATADNARYNYQTGKGVLTASAKKQVRLQLQEGTQQTVTAHANRVQFDTNAQIFVLSGNVLVTRVTPEGTQTARAQKATLKQLENYVLLEGNAEVSDGENKLQADTVLYDGAHNESYAYGARPLATGKTEQGTFAFISDKVTSDAAGNVVKLDGRVQGWVVSPALNQNKINTQF